AALRRDFPAAKHPFEAGVHFYDILRCQRVSHDQKNLRARRARQNLWLARILWSRDGECQFGGILQVGSRRIPRRLVTDDVMLWQIVAVRTVELEAGDSDFLSLRKVGKMVPANRRLEVGCAADERRPFGGEVVAQAEQ